MDCPKAICLSQGGGDQTIRLFDYQNGVWETVDVRAASRFSDRVDTVALAGDLSRFVEPATLNVKARIEFTSAVQR